MSANTTKQRRMGALSGVLATVSVLAILVVINLIAARHDIQKDVTSNKRFTVSDQTRQLLENLKEPVKAYSFYRETDGAYETVKDLLQQYDTVTDQFTFQFIDLDREIGMARKFDVTAFETIVLEMGDDNRKVMEPTENALTNALVKLTRGSTRKKVYFTRGQGELDTESMEGNGLSFLKMTLNDANYATEVINLMTVDSVPEDCAVLAIVGPAMDPPESVIKMVSTYVSNGGHLFIALEPGSGIAWRTMLTDMGIDAANNVIVDPNGFQNVFQPVVEEFKEHEITKDFDMGLVFHIAGTVSRSREQNEEWQIVELGTTGEDTWVETDLSSLENSEPVFNEERHSKGAVPIVAVAEQYPFAVKEKGEPGRIVVAGDADFTSNIFFQTFAAHEPFIMNAFHWLANEKDLIAIPPRDTISQPLLLHGPQLLLGFVIPIVILPMIVALIGIVRIISRRRAT